MNSLPPWAKVTPERRAHVERVATLIAGWADAMQLSAAERDRWLRATWLHDALRDASEDELRQLVPTEVGPNELLHGPAAAARAAAEGEADPGVLSAVHWHSLGSAHWDMTGKALYCADFLEPGRSFDKDARVQLATQFPTAPDQVLLEVARRRLSWLIKSGWTIPETTWRFWNHVAGERPM